MDTHMYKYKGNRIKYAVGQKLRALSEVLLFLARVHSLSMLICLIS